MRKIFAPLSLWADLLDNANFRETLRQYLQNDQALAFMNSVKSDKG